MSMVRNEQTKTVAAEEGNILSSLHDDHSCIICVFFIISVLIGCYPLFF